VADASPDAIRLVRYDRTYLNRSWDWLRDPEIKELTMAGDFTREDQEAFFASLPERNDYKIWGIQSADGDPIGAAGIKNIRGTTGEFWCYIGERSWWGRRIGGRILELCEEKARELGLDELTMIAGATNDRSIGAFEKMGFTPEPEGSTATVVRFSKSLPKIEIFRYSGELSAAWDRVVSSSRNGLFQFHRAFMDYHSDRFADISAVAIVNGEPAAVLPASIDTAAGIATSHAGLTFGGVVLKRELRGEVAIRVIDAMLEGLRTWGARELEVRLLPQFLCTYPSAEVDYALWRRGFALVRRDLSSAIPLHDSIPINSSKKQAIAKAEKMGLLVEEGHLPQFHALLGEVLGWRHGIAPVHTLAELELLCARFPDQIFVRSARREEEMLAGVLVFRYQNAWHTQYMAASVEGRRCGALDLIIARLLSEARAAGAKWLSFGISTSDQGRKLNEGLLWQKESYGARSVTHDFVRGTL
jgi:RimJ/RimL family protein N-acetyltransferase